MSIKRLAFLSRVDPNDIRGWSGVPYHMMHELKRRFREVHGIYPPAVIGRLPRVKLASKLSQFTGRRFRVGMNKPELRWRARRISKQIESIKPDAIFVAGVDDYVPFLITDLPIIHHSDTTFAAIYGYYPEFENLPDRIYSLGEYCARRSIETAAINIYPSQWAADSALHDYHADPSTLHVVPYGANLNRPPTHEIATQVRPQGTCKLLLVGGDWKRKRGDIAVGVVEALVEQGIEAQLSVIGNCPIKHPRVNRYGFLSKGHPKEAKLYSSLWAESHFFILPTKAECFGMVFAEAAAWGMPVISCATGGVPEAVESGVTGELLDVDAPPKAYADRIKRLWSNEQAYTAMQRAARDRYEHTLNWSAWGNQVELLIRTHLS